MDFVLILSHFLCLFNLINSEVIQLNYSNYKEVFANHEVVFINFYADWCGFSRMLSPEFEQASETIAKEFDSKKVAFAKVDCDAEATLAREFQIIKYPTLKQIINAKVFKNEYRGGRSSKALSNYVRKLLTDPIKHLTTANDIEKIDENKGAVIGYFGVQPNTTQEYNTLLKVAKILRDDCNFYWSTGEASISHHHNGMQNFLSFKPSKSKPSSSDIVYPGSLLSFDELVSWANTNCIPLVREITFENAEQLIEEKLPLMVLFYLPGETNSIKEYTNLIKKELYLESSKINFLTADGLKFAHPLQHLGKSKKDLPLIAIDSLRHMFLFPNFNDIRIPNRLKQFIDDLHSGKLHRQFHFGPDPDTEPQEKNTVQTTAPESAFKSLQPSNSRYTILKDEL